MCMITICGGGLTRGKTLQADVIYVNAGEFARQPFTLHNYSITHGYTEYYYNEGLFQPYTTLHSPYIIVIPKYLY